MKFKEKVKSCKPTISQGKKLKKLKNLNNHKAHNNLKNLIIKMTETSLLLNTRKHYRVRHNNLIFPHKIISLSLKVNLKTPQSILRIVPSLSFLLILFLLAQKARIFVHLLIILVNSKNNFKLNKLTISHPMIAPFKLNSKINNHIQVFIKKSSVIAVATKLVSTTITTTTSTIMIFVFCIAFLAKLSVLL